MAFVGSGPAAYYARLSSLSAFLNFLHLFALLQLSYISIILILPILLVLGIFSLEGKAIVSDEVNRGLDLTEQTLGFLLPLSSIGGGADAMDLLSAIFLNFLETDSQTSHENFHLAHVHFGLLITVLLGLAGPHLLQLLAAPKCSWVYLG
jgi:hypothetical protein